jgi:hypothetical protein
MDALARDARAWAERAEATLRVAFGVPTERDRLAKLISDVASTVDPAEPGSAHDVADAILSAGYRRTR